MEQVVAQLHLADIVLVVAAGNYNEDLDTDYLTILGGPATPTIVVGGVANDGSLWPYSPIGDKISVNAESSFVNVADHTANNLFRNSAGTSYAAAAVSGLAATFLTDVSLATDLNVAGEVAKRVKWMIGANALTRILPSPAIRNIACNGQRLTAAEKIARQTRFSDMVARNSL